MKPHTPEQLNGLKGFVDAQTDTYERFEANGIAVEYRVIHIPEELRPFAFPVMAAVVGQGEAAEYEIAVSDDVPVELRGLWAWHELHDFAIVGAETEQRCFTSEETIVDFLQHNNPALLEPYLAARITFYEGLGDYMQAEREEYGDDSRFAEYDIDGVALAYTFLTEQLETL